MGKITIVSGIVGAIIIGMILGLTTLNEPAEAGIVSGNCDGGSGTIEHWDKIFFDIDRSVKHSSLPNLLKARTFDIKVFQDPQTVTVLEETVANFLNAAGYTKFNGGPITPLMIFIVDVDYDIACIFLPPGPGS